MRIVDPRHEVVLEERRQTPGHGAFDRMAFARWALEQLRPSGVTIVIYPGASTLRVQRGRDLARGPRATWALVGIPQGESRESIALALADAAGAPARPWLLQVLMQAPRAAG